MSDSAVWCCGCAEWSAAMSYGGGDVRLRVRAVCVAGAAGSVRVREEHVEDNRAHVPRRRRGRQSCRRAMTASEKCRVA